MKIFDSIKQIVIIAIFSLLGELINRLLPLPIPGSIYGMFFLFLALMGGVVKLSSVKKISDILIYLLPLLFIAPAVGLLEIWPTMKAFLVEFLIITIVSTVIVAIVAGRVTQYLINHKKNR